MHMRKQGHYVNLIHLTTFKLFYFITCTQMSEQYQGFQMGNVSLIWVFLSSSYHAPLGPWVTWEKRWDADVSLPIFLLSSPLFLSHLSSWRSVTTDFTLYHILVSPALANTKFESHIAHIWILMETLKKKKKKEKRKSLAFRMNIFLWIWKFFSGC